MLHIEIPKHRSSLPGYLFSFLLLIIVLYLFLYSMGAMQSRTKEDQLNMLTDAIRRASVQCYSIEGRYPPSVEYLEDNYGIVIDRERYNVFYDGWAANIMPDITVLPGTRQAKRGGQL